MSAQPSEIMHGRAIFSDDTASNAVLVVPQVTVLETCDEKVYSAYSKDIPSRSYIVRYGVSAYTADPTTVGLGTKVALFSMKGEADAFNTQLQEYYKDSETPAPDRISGQSLQTFITNLEKHVHDSSKVQLFNPAVTHSELIMYGHHSISCGAPTLYDIGNHVYKLVGDVWSR